jgi:hypothetical protein
MKIILGNIIEGFVWSFHYERQIRENLRRRGITIYHKKYIKVKGRVAISWDRLNEV